MKNNLNIILSESNDKIITEFAKSEKSILQKEIESLVSNYKTLIYKNISILEKVLETEKSKAIILYQLGFIIELFYKKILLEHGISTIEETCNLKHSISGMYRLIDLKCMNIKTKESCNYIKARAALIKMDDGNNIDYNLYSHFKYNYKNAIIFNSDISETDIEHIKEIIEKCKEQIM